MESRAKAPIGAAWLATALALLLVLGTGAGCSSLFGTDAHHFVIGVDSISVPDTIAPNSTLTARFFGGIGPNGCYQLDRVERVRSAGVLELRFHGTSTDGFCPQVPSYLDHVEEVLPPVEDPFRIRVLQPDGPALEKVVRVR